MGGLGYTCTLRGWTEASLSISDIPEVLGEHSINDNSVPLNIGSHRASCRSDIYSVAAFAFHCHGDIFSKRRMAAGPKDTAALGLDPSKVLAPSMCKAPSFDMQFTSLRVPGRHPIKQRILHPLSRPSSQKPSSHIIQHPPLFSSTSEFQISSRYD